MIEFMIMADIYVPTVDKSYDFNLDENAKISDIIEEIAVMIAQKERTTLAGSVADLQLCDRLRRQMLPRDVPLKLCGIRNGSSMILV